MWRIFQMCVFISLSPSRGYAFCLQGRFKLEKREGKNSANTFRREIGLTNIGNGMRIKQSRAMLYRSQSFLILLPFAIIVSTYTGSTAAPGREMGHLRGGFQHLVVVSAFRVCSLICSNPSNSRWSWIGIKPPSSGLIHHHQVTAYLCPLSWIWLLAAATVPSGWVWGLLKPP